MSGWSEHLKKHHFLLRDTMTWGSTWLWEKVFHHWGKHITFISMGATQERKVKIERKSDSEIALKLSLSWESLHRNTDALVLGCWKHKSFWYLVHGIDRIQSHISCTQHNTCTKTICTSYVSITQALLRYSLTNFAVVWNRNDGKKSKLLEPIMR